MKLTAEVFESQSQRAKTMDLLKMAEIAPSVSAWLKCPNRLDLPGLDTPDAELVFTHRSKRSQAQDLARAARRKVPVEVWVGDPSKVDLKGGLDSPSSKKARKFKVMPKKEAEEHAKKQKLDKQKELDHQFLDGKISKEEYERERTEGRTLPTSEEITQRATEIFKEKQAKAGLPSITPEKKELSEAGLLQAAREDLMRTGSKVDAQVLQYVHDLNSELEPMGFRVVEID